MRVLEKQVRTALRSFVASQAAESSLIRKVLADYREEEVDLLFVVEGDLYEGETQALSIMPLIREHFPNKDFDVMVLPVEHFNEDFKWGLTPEVVYESS